MLKVVLSSGWMSQQQAADSWQQKNILLFQGLEEFLHY
jgi:hypothetical protein